MDDDVIQYGRRACVERGDQETPLLLLWRHKGL